MEQLYIPPHIDKAVTKHSLLVGFYAFAAGAFLVIALIQGGFFWVLFGILIAIASGGVIVATGILRDAIESDQS